MEVEHLWQYNETEHGTGSRGSGGVSSNSGSSGGPDFLSNLCNIADHRLYKIVKWCKSLPLFKNITVFIIIITILFQHFQTKIQNFSCWVHDFSINYFVCFFWRSVMISAQYTHFWRLDSLYEKLPSCGSCGSRTQESFIFTHPQTLSQIGTLRLCYVLSLVLSLTYRIHNYNILYCI